MKMGDFGGKVIYTYFLSKTIVFAHVWRPDFNLGYLSSVAVHLRFSSCVCLLVFFSIFFFFEKGFQISLELNNLAMVAGTFLSLPNSGSTRTDHCT